MTLHSTSNSNRIERSIALSLCSSRPSVRAPPGRALVSNLPAPGPHARQGLSPGYWSLKTRPGTAPATLTTLLLRNLLVTMIHPVKPRQLPRRLTKMLKLPLRRDLLGTLTRDSSGRAKDQEQTRREEVLRAHHPSWDLQGVRVQGQL